uniref:X-box-binding protein 1 n=1 Tax=Cacopsylla melanoneura TaxID=428564 RepID=A0A8D8WER8_9HEMI
MVNMPIYEESSSSGMEFCDDDIKVEEISVTDELDYCDSLSDSGSIVSQSSQNMIFTQIYVPQDGRMMVPSPMEYKNRPGRKQKLEHLSFEEKLIRKKLKNREAAQTSRDRKKARMSDLELQVRYLQEQNERLRLEKEEACKENERLKQEITKPASVPAPSSLTSATNHPSTQPSLAEECSSATQSATRPGSVRLCSSEGLTKRADPCSNGSVTGQESAEFLELSPQKTTGPVTAVMQGATRSVSSPAAALHNLGQEVLVMVTTVASLLLTILLTPISPLPPGQTVPTGTGSLTLTRAHLQSAYNSLNSSQQAYLSQLLLIIAKELNQAPRWWGPEQDAWSPVHFLHANVPLFLQHLPPLPPPPVQSSPSPPPPRRPSLSDIIEVSMRKVPVPSC